MTLIPDVSHHVYVKDWDKIKGQAPFLLAKATQGTAHIDSKLKEFISGCEQHKIPYWLYCYLDADGNELAQAKYMVQVCSKLIGPYFIGYCIDAEKNGAKSKYPGKLPSEDGVKRSLEYISGLGYKSMLYGKAYLSLAKSRGKNVAYWWARYGKNDGRYNAAYATEKEADLHQYTSTGSCPGLSGKGDLNRVTGYNGKALSWFTTPLKTADDKQTQEKENMAEKTGEGLAAYARSKLGTPYFYGSKMKKLTEEFMKQMHRQYPKVVTDNYMKKARTKKMVGKICCDCSGLIGAYRGLQLGSSQLYAKAKKRMPIKNLKDFAVGTVLWHTGHVAVFIGYEKDVPYCIEERGIDYGCVKSKVNGRGFTYGLTFADMEYTYSNKVDGTSKGTNPYKKPSGSLTKGAKGEAVKWLQWELVEAGYKLDVDGKFGSKTETAVKAYQASAKLDVKWPGTVGSKTIASLAEN